TLYILRLMARAPAEGEAALEPGPIRTAGITPASSFDTPVRQGSPATQDEREGR
ncbi:MAG: hypothetical protein QOJ53_1793, partial [Sphingomonadales bacterium]|nr:hypothetical protein [Sphingomonadales bacterium]